MARKKSEAHIYSARMNPINPEEKAVMEIITKYGGQGISFKDMVLEAFLEREGFTPGLFQREPQAQGVGLEDMEGLLKSFAGEIIGQLKQIGFRAGTGGESNEADDNAEKISANLARGFMQRRKGNG